MQRSRRFIHLFRREDSLLSYYCEIDPSQIDVNVHREERDQVWEEFGLEIFSLRFLNKNRSLESTLQPDVSQDKSTNLIRKQKMVPQIDPAALHYHGPTKKNDNFTTGGIVLESKRSKIIAR